MDVAEDSAPEAAGDDEPSSVATIDAGTLQGANEQLFRNTAGVIEQKMVWAAQKLRKETDLVRCRQLAELINACTEARKTLSS